MTAHRNNLSVPERRALVSSCIGLAYQIAGEYRRARVEDEDLHQDAFLGLCLAAERFDPGRGFQFSTYAADWIRALCRLRALRDLSQVSVGARKATRKIYGGIGRVRSQLLAAGEEPTRARVAGLLGVPENEVAAIEGRLLAGRADAPLDAIGDWQDEAAADPGPSPEECAARAEVSRRVREAIAQLDPRKRRVVRGRLAGKTLQQLGDALGVSRQAIQQNEVLARRRLAQALEDLDDNNEGEE